MTRQSDERLKAPRSAIRVSPFQSSHNYQEIAYDRNGKTLRGCFWTHKGMVTVKSSDGRQKSTHIGGCQPHTLAWLMLIELEKARLDNPMFR
jgi:hypothetical protein